MKSGVVKLLLLLAFSTPRTASAVRWSAHVSETLQVRIPRVTDVPNTFSNVLGVGGGLLVEGFEITARVRLIYSFTRAEVEIGNMIRSTNAKGLGYDIGARIAVGWFDVDESGFYFFTFPAFSSWRIEGEFENRSRFKAKIDEFGADFGIGYKLRITKKFFLDLSFSGPHIGFRPGSEDVLTITGYPGLSIDGIWHF